jgi:hypothetical protein
VLFSPAQKVEAHRPSREWRRRRSALALASESL